MGKKLGTPPVDELPLNETSPLPLSTPWRGVRCKLLLPSPRSGQGQGGEVSRGTDVGRYLRPVPGWRPATRMERLHCVAVAS